MVLVGFKPECVLGTRVLPLVYQFSIRTRVVGRLGPFKYSGFNTPSLNQVHQGTGDWFTDRNYSGVLTVWDRVF